MFLDVRLVIDISINIFLVYLFYNFFAFVFSAVAGLAVSEFNQSMRYWDGLSVTQLLVKRMGYLKKGRVAE